jgi:hypothetical protein
MAMIEDIILSIFLIASLLFLVYEMRRFKMLHARKYELPTEKIWEKFVGVRPEEMADSDLTQKIQRLETKMEEIHDDFKKHRKLMERLVEELGK